MRIVSRLLLLLVARVPLAASAQPRPPRRWPGFLAREVLAPAAVLLALTVLTVVCITMAGGLPS